MSTVIMMFILPLGILLFFWDKKNYTQSLAVFREYIVKMQHADLDDAAKMQRIDAMFYENGYKIVRREAGSLIAEKKHFNIGVLFIMFGLLNYFGIFGYVIFYRFFLKPRRLSVDLLSDDPLAES
ncbi:hypothetical protein [Sulfurimonas sp. HSL3-7]|uniref:hypothetical protein n=1 Tax=Sulfonitrofixus jiaomeiensis TaxID=3131938 RepID=UPI0031F9EB6D